MSFLQSSSKRFVDLIFGLNKNFDRAKLEYENLLKPGEKICNKSSKDLSRFIIKIVNRLKAIVKILNSIGKVLNSILAFTKILKPIILGLTALIKILRFFPLPARWATVGIINKMGELLTKSDFKVRTLLLIVLGVDIIVRFVYNIVNVSISQINLFLSQLSYLSEKIKECENGVNISSLEESILETKQAITDLEQIFVGFNNLSRVDTYKGFVFEIIEEKPIDVSIKINRRYAIAINTSGITELQGTPTYATDKETLVNELKFIIDRDNLNGYPEGFQLDINESLNKLDAETTEKYDKTLVLLDSYIKTNPNELILFENFNEE